MKYSTDEVLCWTCQLPHEGAQHDCVQSLKKEVQRLSAHYLNAEQEMFRMDVERFWSLVFFLIALAVVYGVARA